MEISKTLHYSDKDISTPLGVSNMNLIDEPIVLATILRAGLPLGLLNYFDQAENCFISATGNIHLLMNLMLKLNICQVLI